MLINQSTEYARGSYTKRQIKKLTGRQEDYSFLMELFQLLAGMAPGAICMVVGDRIIHSVNWTVAGAVGILFGALILPAVCRLRVSMRYSYRSTLRDQTRLIPEHDIMLRLVMTDWVKAMLLAEQRYGNAKIKNAVDEFMDFLLPYRDWFHPPESKFLTAAWEMEHGLLSEHPKLIAIGKATGNVEELQTHARNVIRELRVKRAGQLQRSLLNNSKTREQENSELYYQQKVLLTGKY